MAVDWSPVLQGDKNDKWQAFRSVIKLHKRDRRNICSIEEAQ